MQTQDILFLESREHWKVILGNYNENNIRILHNSHSDTLLNALPKKMCCLKRHGGHSYAILKAWRTGHSRPFLLVFFRNKLRFTCCQNWLKCAVSPCVINKQQQHPSENFAIKQTLNYLALYDCRLHWKIIQSNIIYNYEH